MRSSKRRVNEAKNDEIVRSQKSAFPPQLLILQLSRLPLNKARPLPRRQPIKFTFKVREQLLRTLDGSACGEEVSMRSSCSELPNPEEVRGWMRRESQVLCKGRK